MRLQPRRVPLTLRSYGSHLNDALKKNVPGWALNNSNKAMLVTPDRPAVSEVSEILRDYREFFVLGRGHVSRPPRAIFLLRAREPTMRRAHKLLP